MTHPFNYKQQGPGQKNMQNEKVMQNLVMNVAEPHSEV
jgi:hypothetical protein